MQSTDSYLSSLREATLRGSEELLSASSAFFARVLGGDDFVLVALRDGTWQFTYECTGSEEIADVVKELPEASHAWDRLIPLSPHGYTFVPVRPGSLGMIVSRVLADDDPIAIAISVAAQMCDLLLKEAERIESLRILMEDVADTPSLPVEILSVRDIDQLLLSSALTALQLIEADMAGVFLLEAGELVMRSCVGHRTAQTAHLRMRKGQGLAGQVLDCGEPRAVDDYLSSSLITHDFDTLARNEGAFSALAAPLAIDGEIIGVLEVWSRRPSVYSESHFRRIVGVANLVSIAIDNASIFEKQQRSVEKLSQAQLSLQGELTAIQRARSLQRALSQLLLDGKGLSEILRLTSIELNAPIVVLSNECDVIASHPTIENPAEIVDDVQRLVQTLNADDGQLKVIAHDERWVMLQKIVAGQEQLGWLYATTEHEPDMGIELAIGEAFLHGALCQVIQRKADYVRSSQHEEIVWDLLKGSAPQRLMAIDRSKWLRIQLERPQRVLRAVLWDAEQLLQEENSQSSEFEHGRHRLLARVREVMARVRAGDLVGIRGNELAAIVSITTLQRIRRLIDDLNVAIVDLVPGARPIWGVSGICERPVNLDRADSEARMSVRAGQRLNQGEIISYEELGVIRLFVAPEGDESIGAFVEDVLGRVIENDRKKNGSLIETIRAYFDVDCSQQRAAEKLFVHHKTVRYRLNRIEELGGLDLSKHDDRMKVDLALKVYSVLRSQEAPTGGGVQVP